MILDELCPTSDKRDHHIRVKYVNSNFVLLKAGTKVRNDIIYKRHLDHVVSERKVLTSTWEEQEGGEEEDQEEEERQPPTPHRTPVINCRPFHSVYYIYADTRRARVYDY